MRAPTPTIPQTTVGISEDIVKHLGLTTNNAVIRSVLEQQQESTSQTKERSAHPAFPGLRSLQIRDWVCVPMIVKPRVRGIMLVADIKPREFSARAKSPC